MDAVGLTQQQQSQFEEDGFLIVRNQIPVEHLRPIIDELNQRVEVGTRAAVRQGLLAANQTFENAPLETRAALVSNACRDRNWLWKTFFSDHHPRTEGVFALTTSPALLDAVESLTGPEILAHPLFNLRCKLPNHETTVVRWHQDIEGLERDALDTLIVTAWMPLVRATAENGCLQVIQGSHRTGLLPHGFPDSAGNKELKAIADADVPSGPIVDIELEAGDMLLMNERTVHRSIPNHSETIRWSFDARYNKIGARNGRSLVPGFVARSRSHPREVTASLREWNELLDQPAITSTVLNFRQWHSDEIDEDGWAASRCSLQLLNRPDCGNVELTIEVPEWAGLRQQEVTLLLNGKLHKTEVLQSGEHQILVPSPDDEGTLRIDLTSSAEFSLPGGDGRQRSFRLKQVEHARRPAKFRWWRGKRKSA